MLRSIAVRPLALLATFRASEVAGTLPLVLLLGLLSGCGSEAPVESGEESASAEAPSVEAQTSSGDGVEAAALEAQAERPAADAREVVAEELEEEPLLQDVLLRNVEVEMDEVYEDPPDFTSESPFDQKAFNDVVGVGGGAGGRFGGRFGGRRSISAHGGKAVGRETGHSTEAYDHLRDNAFVRVVDDPLSTFSIDVDTASYTNVRRFLNEGRLPPPDAVRIEELLNYFPYAYAEPAAGEPFAVDVEVASAPWNERHRLVRIGLRGRSIPAAERRPSNLVFLLDVSGSMKRPAKLPLLRRGLRLLVENLDERDSVAIVVYAGSSGLVLPPTSGCRKAEILGALDALEAGGSTNGGAGIALAYETARAHFLPGGTNRVILATDGDFNVGISDRGSLVRRIEVEARSGVFLTVLGFGTGNLKDSAMEELADKGNGHYAYVDSLHEARKVLVTEMGATLETIAKDVKIQVEMNPAEVASFRLIGYVNRKLAHADFADDKKDAGEVGAGHRVTALYEVVPAVAGDGDRAVAPLRYQADRSLTPSAATGELLTVRLRWKAPDGDASRLLEVPVVDAGAPIAAASTELRFAAAVAGFGMLLRDSEHRGSATADSVLALARSGLGADEGGHRAELVALVERWSGLVDDGDARAAADIRRPR